MGWVSGDGGVCRAVFAFGCTALWAVGIPSLVATEILEVQRVYFIVLKLRASALWLCCSPLCIEVEVTVGCRVARPDASCVGKWRC